MTTEPVTDADPRYGDAGATPAPWSDACRRLASAEVSWLTTVRPDGRPHVTPLLTVFRDGILYFSTGTEERKARNLDKNPNVVITVGTCTYSSGFDVVVEGAAERITDRPTLDALALVWAIDHGSEWQYEVVEGGFAARHGVAAVYRVRPVTAFGFSRGPFGQTRWRFAVT
jgi:uncharacterized pyridoxamine 5'-phosphate oxidase family protein